MAAYLGLDLGMARYLFDAGEYPPTYGGLTLDKYNQLRRKTSYRRPVDPVAIEVVIDRIREFVGVQEANVEE